MTKHITLPKINKFVYIALAAAVVLFVLAFATAYQVRQERLDKAIAAAEKQRQADTIADLKTQLEVTQKALTAVSTREAAICDYVRSTNTARKVAVPPLCVKN